MASDHILLNAVAANSTSAVKKCSTPVAVWVITTGAGETVTLEAAPPASDGTNSGLYAPIKECVESEIVPIWLPGPYFLRARLEDYDSGTTTVLLN